MSVCDAVERVIFSLARRSHTISLKQHPGAATDNTASNGGTVCNCSKALARYLDLQRHESLRGAAVIEIGAGTGLSSIAAALLGAHVTITDKASMVGLLADNIDANADAVAGEVRLQFSDFLFSIIYF